MKPILLAALLASSASAGPAPARVERFEEIARAEDGSLAYAAQVVLGQGLHQLVRAQLDALAGGLVLAVRFGIPSRLDAYAFRIERVASQDPAVVRLRIGIDNWLLALIAPSLEVEYERATRRLLSYHGVSNLPGPGGDPLKVRILYRYDEPEVAGALVAGWAR